MCWQTTRSELSFDKEASQMVVQESCWTIFKVSGTSMLRYCFPVVLSTNLEGIFPFADKKTERESDLETQIKGRAKISLCVLIVKASCQSLRASVQRRNHKAELG